MVPLPRKREEMLKDLNELRRDAMPTADGQIVQAICLLGEIILDATDYPTITENN